MKNLLYFATGCILLLVISCKPAIKPQSLYGTWKYTKLENPNANPPDTMTYEKLQANSPSIRFTNSDSLIITWSDTVLLRGKFVVDGSNINFTGTSGGKATSFPFIVSKLTDKQIIFETKGEDGSRVTAVKE